MNIDFRFYWTLFLRRLPAMAAVFLLCAGVGVALAFKLPTTYSSKARMQVEEPQITGLSGMGGSGGGQQLDTIQNNLMTRANLLGIARELRVFGPNDGGMTPDEIVAAMRAATDIDKSSGRDRATTMSIAFNADKPETAYAVANQYVTLIRDENKRLQSRPLTNTLEFYKQQVETLKKDLEGRSTAILEFKQENQNALPESLNFRLNRESLVQERIASLERQIEGLRAERQRRVEIFEATGRIAAPQQQNLSPEEQQLAKLNAQLEGMRLRFSDTNPRVAILISQIAQLEAQVAAAGGASPQADVTQETIFDLTMAQYDTQIENLEKERDTAMKEAEELRASIEQTGTNQIELDGLQRDYANAQSQYNAAIARRDNAQVNENASTSGYIGRIKIIEPPNPPDRPSSPNRPVVAAAGVGVGLVAMAGLFFLLEVLNRTLRRPAELTRALGVTPLATIPYMQTRRHFWTRRILKLTLLIAVIIAVPLALWAIDTHYRRLDLIYDGLLRRLGL